ncbi:MAG TPA: MoaD/ThiS family protein [Streptosporangiaceae bacterium]|nr:MoaD/ThiS family protein [Streptosporangiaceae bacterium]
MAIVTMRYWAAAKDAAGVAEEIVTADTLAAALAAAGARDRDDRSGTGRAAAAGGSRLGAVLARSSFLIDGHPVGTRAAEAVALADGAIIEVLPPFAGG